MTSAPPPPRDTRARLQRASRPVIFDARGELWAAVHEGVVYSVDLNDRLQFSPVIASVVSSGPLAPPPGAALLPFQRQLPPQLPPPPAGGGGGGRRRVPRREVALNALATELKDLEDENDALKRRVALQDRVIVGFCELHVYNRENQLPS